MENVQALNIDVITGTINPVPKVRDAGDDQLHVVFESASHFNDIQTREQGRAVFEMKDYVKIIVPGDQTSMIHRPVRPSDLERFPRQWEAYKAGREQQIGFPLSQWNGITKAQCDELAFFKILTVEHLAGVSDSVIQKFRGLATLRDSAKIWLEQRKGEEPALRLAAEKAAREEENNALKAKIQMLEEAVAKLMAERESDEEVSEQPRKGRTKAA